MFIQRMLFLQFVTIIKIMYASTGAFQNTSSDLDQDMMNVV